MNSVYASSVLCLSIGRILLYLSAGEYGVGKYVIFIHFAEIWRTQEGLSEQRYITMVALSITYRHHLPINLCTTTVECNHILTERFILKAR